MGSESSFLLEMSLRPNDRKRSPKINKTMRKIVGYKLIKILKRSCFIYEFRAKSYAKEDENRVKKRVAV